MHSFHTGLSVGGEAKPHCLRPSAANATNFPFLCCPISLRQTLFCTNFIFSHCSSVDRSLLELSLLSWLLDRQLCQSCLMVGALEGLVNIYKRSTFLLSSWPSVQPNFLLCQYTIISLIPINSIWFQRNWIILWLEYVNAYDF